MGTPRDMSKAELTDVHIKRMCSDHIGEMFVSLEIGWSTKEHGFGILILSVRGDGELFIDSETLSPEFAKRVFGYLVDHAKPLDP